MIIKKLKYIIAWFRIPKGPYCNGCPYWKPDVSPIKIGDRTIAYCKYLDKTDLDICRERENFPWKEQKSGDTCKGHELPLSFSSLLWDGCKECGIKDY